MKYDILLQQFCIDHDLVRAYARYSREKYQLNQLSLHIDTSSDYYQYLANNVYQFEFDNIIDYGVDAWDCAKCLFQARNRKRQRIKKYIRDNFNGKYYIFLTMTFTDEVLLYTSRSERRKLIKEFLKDNTLNSVCNIDFGSKNGREHYHALVSVNDLISHEKYLYGNINFKEVQFHNYENIDDITDYMLKLINHSVKDSTDNRSLIYT